MTINEALRLSIDDPDRCKKIVNALGKREVYDCLPFTAKEICKAIKTDSALNNLPMRRWDFAAGFDTGRNGSQCRLIGSSLMSLMKAKLGVTYFSCATNVSILKTTARMLVEDMEGK